MQNLTAATGEDVKVSNTCSVSSVLLTPLVDEVSMDVYIIVSEAVQFCK